MEYISNLFDEFINRYNFKVVYKEQNYPFFIKNLSNPILDMLPPNKAIDVLKSNAVQGNNSLGFFHQTPNVSLIDYPISNAFLLVTLKTHYIHMPTIFVKSLDELTKSLSFAFNQSKKHKLPINIVIANEININVKTNKLYIENVEFIKSSPADFSNTNIINLKESLNSISEDFKNHFDKIDVQHIDLFSLNSNRGIFFNYLIPMSAAPSKQEIENCGSIPILENEEEFIKSLFYQFNINVSLKTEAYPESTPENDILCPGCPFLIIIKNYNLQCDNIYTNIHCNTVKRIFQLKQGTMLNFIGISLEKNDFNNVFICNLSDFEPAYVSKSIIYLNNFSDEEEKKFFNVVKYNKNMRIFDYSCNNIIKNKTLTIVDKKCKCIKEDKDPLCIKETLCPALYLCNNIIKINEQYCVGCMTCKKYCPYRAIK
jgi:hypothetical protein